MSALSSRMLSALLLFSVASVLTQSVAAGDCAHQGNQHNYTFGQRSGRLLYSDRVSLKSKLWRVNDVDVSYPKSGTAALGQISYIEITDIRKDGTGGCAYLANGGVGQYQVTIHFKTQRNHGLDFNVQIYGH